MKFENSTYCNTLNHYKLETSFGNFYFCEKFFIAELHTGVHFDWPKIEVLANEIIAFYGKNVKLDYISNRVNSYSIDPQNWIKIEKYNVIMRSAIVCYNHMMYMNASLEKRFSKGKIYPCLSLNEAIEWVMKLEEVNPEKSKLKFILI
ncbi:hypothetical protein [Flavivirga spongiicola]|uniref:STAS/SEC14 domain-containing protein n=1 Tax=Flavivirga spongiicola TaxID=421621 RepID=A0ABU7XY41_9FLAO|nr:hypothetical protein [Flavivirga sp. MEBiC05379]MDO5980699.1 hypothetical protein [Flavivirga sp. MEBiC05379]